MQRFLVRGKRVDTGEWLYGYYRMIDWTPSSIAHYIHPVGSYEWDDVYEVIPETVSRLVNDPCYTDYTDQQYFQGDIIELFSYKRKPLEERVGIVVDEHCFTENGLGRCFPQDTLQARVIGNVWDNPELVGEKYAELYKHYHHHTDTRE